MREDPDRDRAAFEESRRLGYEVRDANYRGVVLVGIGLLVLTAATMGMTYVLAMWATRGTEPTVERRTRRAAPTPMLDAESPTHLRLLREEQEAQQRNTLASYGWIEKPTVARIPIERAIDLLAEQGSLSPSVESDAKLSANTTPMPVEK